MTHSAGGSSNHQQRRPLRHRPNWHQPIPARRPADRRGTHSATGSAAAQYVWGQYVDELIQLKAIASLGPQGVTGVNYLLSDLLYRSAALTQATRALSRRTILTPTATRCCSAAPAPTASGSPMTTCRRSTRLAGMCSRGGSTMRRRGSNSTG